jgi:hypothetical protein
MGLGERANGQLKLGLCDRDGPRRARPLRNQSQGGRVDLGGRCGLSGSSRPNLRRLWFIRDNDRADMRPRLERIERVEGGRCCPVSQCEWAELQNRIVRRPKRLAEDDTPLRAVNERRDRHALQRVQCRARCRLALRLSDGEGSDRGGDSPLSWPRGSEALDPAPQRVERSAVEGPAGAQADHVREGRRGVRARDRRDQDVVWQRPLKLSAQLRETLVSPRWARMGRAACEGACERALSGEPARLVRVKRSRRRGEPAKRVGVCLASRLRLKQEPSVEPGHFAAHERLKERGLIDGGLRELRPRFDPRGRRGGGRERRAGRDDAVDVQPRSHRLDFITQREARRDTPAERERKLGQQ